MAKRKQKQQPKPKPKGGVIRLSPYLHEPEPVKPPEKKPDPEPAIPTDGEGVGNNG